MRTVDFIFPLKGKNDNWAVSKQPPQTSPDLENVRPYDVQGTRARGGQRPGLKTIFTWGAATGQPILGMAQITVTTYA